MRRRTVSTMLIFAWTAGGGPTPDADDGIDASLVDIRTLADGTPPATSTIRRERDERGKVGMS